MKQEPSKISLSDAPPSTIQLWKMLIQFTPGVRSLLIAAVISYTPITWLAVMQPRFIGHMIDEGIRPQIWSVAFMWCLIYLGAVFLRTLLDISQLFLLQLTGQRLVLNLRARLFKHVLQLPATYFQKEPVGKIVVRLTTDTENVAELFSSGAVSVIGDIIFLIATWFMLFWVDPSLACIAILILPPGFWALSRLRAKLRDAFEQSRQAISTLNATIHELFSGMHIIRSYAQMPRAFEKLHHENEHNLQANRQAIFYDAAVYSFVDNVAQWTTIIVAVIAGMYFIDDGMTTGTVVVFVEALTRFFVPVREISNRTTVFQQAFVALSRIHQLINTPQDIVFAERSLPSKEKASSAHLLKQSQDVHDSYIQFKNVSFGYRDDQPVLHAIDLNIAHRERVAIVGRTGSGKSTLMKLLLRVHSHYDGTISIKGHNISDIPYDDMIQECGIVSQDPVLLAGTLRDNLIWVQPNASDADMLRALEEVFAHHILARGGLDLILQEGGSNISAGERQMIALARMILKNPPCILLDEATANIDVETDQKIQVAIHKTIHQRTALIIAHRLETIQKCDRIVVLHEGSIVEQGTHQELLKKQGYYANMHKPT